MTGSPIHRREALRELAWITLGLLAWGAPAQAGTSHEGVAGLLPHRASAAALGAAYLAARPEEADLDTIVAGLGLRTDALPTRGSPELLAAAKRIHGRHIDDFRQGRLIEIEGWMLSITELRLAAVTHLSTSK